MSLTRNHPGNLSLSQLERSLWSRELNVYKLTKIEVAGTKTRSTHDNANPVPNKSLVLVEDNAEGTVAAPAGTETQPVCRGEALIAGAKKKVAAFRKKVAAAAGAGAAAGGGTPATPATPAPSGGGG